MLPFPPLSVCLPSMSPDVTVEKHCVLVLNQPFSQQPCVESLKYAGKTAPQIIKLLVEVCTCTQVPNQQSVYKTNRSNIIYF